MLLVIGTEPTIIGASVKGLCIEGLWILRSFIVVPYILIIGNVIGNQHLGTPMLRTVFQHIHLFILKNDFSIDPAKTVGTKAYRIVIIGVFCFGHV